MIIIRGKSGKSIVLDKLISKYETETYTPVLLVDAIHAIGLWHSERFIVTMTMHASPDEISKLFRKNGKRKMQMFSVIALELNTNPKNIDAFKKIEKKWGVPCILTVQDDCDVYTYEV
jgi:hypothetical protein